MAKERDEEQIKAIVESTGQRYLAKGGNIRFAGIENGNTIRIMPAGFCWR